MGKHSSKQNRTAIPATKIVRIGAISGIAVAMALPLGAMGAMAQDANTPPELAPAVTVGAASGSLETNTPSVAAPKTVTTTTGPTTGPLTTPPPAQASEPSTTRPAPAPPAVKETPVAAKAAAAAVVDAPEAPAAANAVTAVVSGRTIAIKGSGFTPNQNAITISVDRPGQGLTLPALAASDASGNLSFTISADEVAAGNYTLTVGPTATTTFAVEKLAAYAPVVTAPTQAHIGQASSMTGTGWTRGDVNVTAPDGSTTTAAVATDGTFTYRYTPQASGTLTFTVSDGRTTTPVNWIVAAPAIDPNVSVVAKGDRLVITGSDFTPNSTVDLVADGIGTIDVPTVKANTQGSFVTTVLFNKNSLTGSTVTLKATDVSGEVATTSIDLIEDQHPNAALEKINDTKQGNAVVVKGSGYRPGAPVTVNIEGLGSVDIFTDTEGNFSVSFATTYDTEVGEKGVSVKAGPNSTLTSTVNITEHVFTPMLAPSSGMQGGSATVNGSGFKPGESVVIDAGVLGSQTVTADEDGKVSVNFAIPQGTPTGDITVTGTSEGTPSRTASSTLTVNQVSWNGTLTATVGSAAAGTSVTIGGSGFKPGGTLVLAGPNGNQLVTVDGTGNFAVIVVLSAGQNTFTATPSSFVGAAVSVSVTGTTVIIPPVDPTFPPVDPTNPPVGSVDPVLPPVAPVAPVKPVPVIAPVAKSNAAAALPGLPIGPVPMLVTEIPTGVLPGMGQGLGNMVLPSITKPPTLPTKQGPTDNSTEGPTSEATPDASSDPASKANNEATGIASDTTNFSWIFPVALIGSGLAGLLAWFGIIKKRKNEDEEATSPTL